MASRLKLTLHMKDKARNAFIDLQKRIGRQPCGNIKKARLAIAAGDAAPFILASQGLALLLIGRFAGRQVGSSTLPTRLLYAGKGRHAEPARVWLSLALETPEQVTIHLQALIPKAASGPRAGGTLDHCSESTEG
jgi:hypothetical protein